MYQMICRGLKTDDNKKKLFEHNGRRLCNVVMTQAQVRLYFVRAQG